MDELEQLIKSGDIDPDPDFREVLRILNSAGVRTTSSCQGHAPGTQYPDIQEWMIPYVTCEAAHENLARACELLSWAGEDDGDGGCAEITVSGNRVFAKFPLDWKWDRSVAFLKSKLTP